MVKLSPKLLTCSWFRDESAIHIGRLKQNLDSRPQYHLGMKGQTLEEQKIMCGAEMGNQTLERVQKKPCVHSWEATLEDSWAMVQLLLQF